MLLHDNRLNADMIAQLLDLFEKSGFFGPSTGRSCLSDSRNIRYEGRADVGVSAGSETRGEGERQTGARAGGVDRPLRKATVTLRAQNEKSPAPRTCCGLRVPRGRGPQRARIPPEVAEGVAQIL